jgi:hypothetical protein
VAFEFLGFFGVLEGFGVQGFDVSQLGFHVIKSLILMMLNSFYT